MTATGSHLVALLVGVVSIAVATPQRADRLQYGYNTFVIFQNPMLGLWHNGDGDLPPGKIMPPKLDVTTSTNWGGYTSEWRITNGKLLLQSVSGHIDGKEIRDDALLPGRKFPVVATWYTGKIHLPVGECNGDTQEYESVIVFDIDKGIVKSKSYFPSLRPSQSWNGL
ncbi:MAG: hypothetical protein K1X71_18255 [Pirellulales bacterium]|nr:hypothetical protein [Pirellulales bacterium]